MAQKKEEKEELPPAEGNNIGSVVDRAFADMPDPNKQPPVEKTYVPPKDEPRPKE